MKVPILTALRKRSLKPEIMDQPGLIISEHRYALRSIAKLNRLSASSRTLRREIFSLALSAQGKPLRVLDLACGSGDLSLTLARRAAAWRLPLRFVGCDISPVAIDLAREQASAAGLPVEFYVHDALHESLPQDFDVIMCSLFLHHLPREHGVSLLARMRRATRRRLLVNDLVRSRRGYMLAKVACNVFSRSRMVRYDGPTSVRAAFSLAEAAKMAAEAGLIGARFCRQWPQRFLLAWDRP